MNRGILLEDEVSPLKSDFVGDDGQALQLSLAKASEKGEAPQQIIIDPIFDDKAREESTPIADFFLDDEYYDEDDLDEPGFDQEFDDSFPDDE